MQINISKGVKTFLTITAVVAALTGISFATWIKKSGDVLDSPKDDIRIEARIDSLLRAFEMQKTRTNGLVEMVFRKVHLIEDVQEMDFFFGRSMTDPYNYKDYVLVNPNTGMEHKVEIRRNNEGKLFGFIYDMDLKQTLYIDDDGAEVAYYVLLHDIATGANKNTYLEEE